MGTLFCRIPQPRLDRWTAHCLNCDLSHRRLHQKCPCSATARRTLVQGGCLLLIVVIAVAFVTIGVAVYALVQSL